MTETSHADKYTWKTSPWFWVALAGIVAIAIAVATFGTTQTPHDQFDTMPSYLDEREEYEQALLDHPSRQDDTYNTYIDDSGALYYSGGDVTNGGYCEYRCLVAKEAEGGVAVTVPVSFNFTGYAGDTPALTNIVELTYWDPVDHSSKTIRAAEGETVQLPDVLHFDSTIDNMEVGEISYVVAAAVRLSNKGVIILEDTPLSFEPNCSYTRDTGDMCGWSPRAQVQRIAEGFAACVPDWTEGDGVSPALLPNFDTSVTGVESSAAAKLNYVADATGYAVHTLQIC